MKTIVLGATGLIGSQLVTLLEQDSEFKEIRLLTRKDPFENGKIKNFKVNFDSLSRFEELFSVDTVFCCLGTTIKTAGSKEAFRKVDYDYVIDSAKIAKQMNVRKFLVVSAMGVDAKSFIFYNQVKGEMENALKMIGFDSLQIYRPSLLLGDRNEFRIGEKVGELIGNIFSFVFIGDLKKFKPIPSILVAKAMLNGAKSINEKIVIFESDAMNI